MEAEPGKAEIKATPAEPVPAPLPSLAEPTSAQIAARLSPASFQINVPKNGIFRWLGDISTLARRDGNTIITYDTVNVLTPEERRNAGNHGGQANTANEKLKRIYGLDFDSLPVVNGGDFWQQFIQGLPEIPGGDVAAYQRQHSRAGGLTDFINVAPATLESVSVN